MDKHYLCYEHCVLKLSLNFTWSIKIRASTVKAMSCWSTGWPGLLSAAAGQCWSGHKQGTHVAIYTLMEHSRRHHNEHHASHHCGYEVCSGSYQDASQPLKRQLSNKLLWLLHYAAEALLLVQQRWFSSQLYSTGLGRGHSLKLRQHSDVQLGGGSPSPTVQ